MKNLAEIYESWEWKLEEKLTQANDVVRRIYAECIQFDVDPELYETYMRQKLDEMLNRIGDEQDVRKKGV